MVRRFSMFLLLLASMAGVISTNVVNAGSYTVSVSLDTSRFLGQSGDIDFQLSAIAGNVPITVDFTNYNSTATLHGVTFNDGTYLPNSPPDTSFTGDLAANTLSLFNSDGPGQIAFAAQLVSAFSSLMTFDVTFTGASIGAPSASAPILAISVYDQNFEPLSTGPNGETVIFTVDPTNGIVNQIAYAAVPEPSTFLSLATGIAGIGLAIRRRRFA